jgi:hypothetical protein
LKTKRAIFDEFSHPNDRADVNLLPRDIPKLTIAV